MDLDKGTYYLGSLVPSDGDASANPLLFDSSNLTTHGVIVGMTGSGKTGLGIGLVEEALLNDVPCLIIDPKGDMGNLLLSFPDFKPDDFRPWIDEAEAERDKVTPDDLAASTAEMWRGGLEGAGIGGERLRKLNESSNITIYTPGSGAGVGINVLGSLAAPDIDWETDAELARDEIEGLISSLLLIADIEADPVSDPRHILLATIVEQAWSAGDDLDLAGLIGQIPKPPFRTLGVFDVDEFFPEKDRIALAMKLNGLLASPSFSAWLDGVPLDIERMLGGDGPTKAAVVYLAHLTETERQFIVTLLLSRVITWFRGQSGTSSLRTLIYMDEVFGFVPPVKEPPSKKAILTILKQARAHGVGMVLSTQNPVDLDYKALSNAGTWFIGRLQTERDKGRLLDGLNAASGGVDTAELDNMIAGLDKRQFIHHSTSRSQPEIFGTRWAQSYLAGPLTRDQVRGLMKGARPEVATLEPVTVPDPVTPPGSEPAAIMPSIADRVTVSVADAASPWLEALGAKSAGHRYALGAAAVVQLLYDERAAELNHPETYEAVIYPLGKVLDKATVHSVDHDERDFLPAPPGPATFEPPQVDVGSASYWSGLESDLKNHLVANRTIAIFHNAELGIYSRPGETREDFVTRCESAATGAANAEMAKLKDKYKTKIERVKDQISKAESRVMELGVQAEAKKQEELMTGVGDLLGGLLGGRKASTALGKAASRRTATRNAEARTATAAQALEDKNAALADLEYELEDEFAEITARFEDVAANVETVEVGLEADDVRIAEVRAVWIPIEG
ncbi:MAG: helicase HerA domain-containing protein [Acidimicrobiia bacterium]